MANEGILENLNGGLVSIGQLNGNLPSEGIAVVNNGSKVVNDNSTIEVDNVGRHGIELFGSGPVLENRNTGEIIIGQNGTINSSAIINNGSIGNLDCSVIRIFDDLDNRGFISNEGLFHINAPDLSVDGDFSNNGVIEDIQGTFPCMAPGFQNNELVIAPIDTDCPVVPDVLMVGGGNSYTCLLYTSPSPRDRTRSRMPSSA